MFTLKILAAALVLITGFLQFGLTHWWKDRRTNKYRNARRATLIALVVSGVGGITLLVFDAFESRSSKAEQKDEFERIVGYSAGSLSPNLTVELYVGPNYPTGPTMIVEPKFPGFVL